LKKKRLQGKKILMLLHEHLPRDHRPRREAKALVEHGAHVDFICLRSKGQKKKEVIDGFTVHRLPVEHERGTGVLFAAYEYILFFLLTNIFTLKLYLKNRYDFIHIHNPPDILVFVAIPYKMFGLRLTMDVHDPNPEIFSSRFEKGMDHPLSKMLMFIELVAARSVDNIIITNNVDKDILIKRCLLKEKKFTLLMNIPDPSLYGIQKNDRASLPKKYRERYLILYQGIILKRRGIQILIQTYPKISSMIPNLHFLIIGDGPYRDSLEREIASRGYSEGFSFLGHIPIEELAKYTMASKIGLITFTDCPVNNRGVPNKLFEYMYHMKPIIASDLEGIRSIVDEKTIWYYNPNDPNTFTEAIRDIYTSKNLNLKLNNYSNIRKKYNWEIMKKNLIDIYS